MKKKLFFALIFVICLAVSNCSDSANRQTVYLVDRNTALTKNSETNPQMLVVEIGEEGKLSLNKIETGTISDQAELKEKLKVIFDDRKKAGIGEREVFIDPHGNVSREDLEKLIESLAEVKAAPIRVLRNALE